MNISHSVSTGGNRHYEIMPITQRKTLRNIASRLITFCCCLSLASVSRRTEVFITRRCTVFSGQTRRPIPPYTEATKPADRQSANRQEPVGFSPALRVIAERSASNRYCSPLVLPLLDQYKTLSRQRRATHTSMIARQH